MSDITNVNEVKVESALREEGELDASELDRVSGGYSIGDTLHRFFFAARCIASGNTLTVKGEQLQCRL